MKLSIAMMVKNEEKHLKECLESLNEIREQVDSELIIVDTGSTDNTVNIAKQYTDKVYFHKWNNDFSQMRNITVSYCQGEWFFYIDGDEVIQNPQNIIAFFKSSLYKKYNSATIKIRNFMKNKDNKSYALFTAARLFKKDKDFRFDGAIHNQPVVKNPIYNINAEFVHYGYINDDKKLMEKKFKRTAGILKRELKKDPNNIYYLFQLSVSYSMHKDLKKSLEPITKAYNLVKDKKDKRKYLYVYLEFIRSYMSNNKFDLALKICKEAYKIDSECIDNLSYMATCHVKNHEYIKGIEFYERHIELLKTYDSTKDLGLIYYTTNKKNYELNEIARIYNMLGESKKALEYLNKIDDKEELERCYSVNIPIYIKNDKLNKINDSYKYLKEKDENIEGFLNILEKTIQTLDDKKKKQIYEIFAKDEDDYGVLNKIRINNSLVDYGALDKIDFKEKEMYFGDIFYYILKEDKDISKYLFNLKENRVNRFFTYITVIHKDGKEILNQYMKSLNGINDFNNFKLLKIEKILMRVLITIDYFEDDEYRNVFNEYIEKGYKLLEKIYNKELLKEDNFHYLITDEDEFMVYMNLARKCKNRDSKQYISYLRKALKAYPTMKKGIEIFLDDFKNEEKKKNKEFQIYKDKVKNTIKTLVESGHLENAKALVKELKSMVKGDIEIYSIEAVICIMENDLEKAEELLKEALEFDENNFDLNYNLGYVYENKREYNLSIVYYNKAIKNCRDVGQKEDIQKIVYNIKNTFNI